VFIWNYIISFFIVYTMKKESVPQQQNPTIKENSDASSDRPKSSSHTIKNEKIFTENTQFKHYYTQQPCIDYIENIPNLKLFGEDVDATGKKQFYVINYNTIYLLSKSKKSHLYEHYDDTNPIKLFVDLDIKEEHIPKNANKQQLFDDYIFNCIELITDKLQDYDIEDPEIIVLKSSSDIKLSAHIIFPDVRFENVKEMKFFMSSIDSDLIQNNIIDLMVYRRGLFRMLFNSKLGKNIPLEYYNSYNYNFTTEKDLFMDCLIQNINKDYFPVKVKMPENVKIKKINQIRHLMKKQVHALTDTNINNNDGGKIMYHPISSLEPYVKLLSQKRTKYYGDWIKIGMILHNCNPSEECFNLWDNWSQLSDNYDSKNYNAYKWNSFKVGYYAIASLKHFAKEDSPESYPDLEYSLDNPIFESKKFEGHYLFNNENEKIKDNLSFISQEIINWINDKDMKCLAIKSPYNTGKTKLIMKILNEFGFKRVLFMSYRQTLSQDLYGNFKDLQVRTYLNGEYHAERLICQLESLPKILPEIMFIDNYGTPIPEYDLVILDESESLLNHLVSSTIQNKESIFNLMYSIIYNSTKVLALDGDFHNRSYDFLKSFGNINVVHNTIIKDIKHFVFTNNKSRFEISIEEDLKNGLNIIIVSMSSKIATYLYEYYKNKYECILHCAKAPDKYKKELENVNGFWSKARLVIYSPTVEAGVNFSVKGHFTKMYMVLSHKSTSPRGLLQMGSRVRDLIDSNVLVYLNNVPFKTKANFFKYNEIKDYVCDTYSNYKDPKFILDTEKNKMVIIYDFNLYSKILVHNETEKANKTGNLFVAYLIKLLNEKGHTYEYNEIRNNKNAYKKDTLLKDEVFNGIDIGEIEYNKLFKKVCNNEATREDKIAIEKFEIKKDWKINDVTDDFLTKFYGKTDVLYNLRFLLDESLVKPYCFNKDNTYNIVFDRASKLEQIKMVKEVVLGLGFELPVNEKKLDAGVFGNNIKDVISKCQLFVNVNKSQPLFEYDKMKVCKVGGSIKAFTGFFNSLLKNWGIEIKRIRKVGKINNKSVATNRYLLRYINNIDNYI
jgi:hypothetical protein